MRTVFLWLLLCGMPFSCLYGQHVFLDFFHPFHKKLMPLRTDSLYLRAQNANTRAIAWTYADNAIQEWREQRVSEGRIWTIRQYNQPEGTDRVFYTLTRDSQAHQTTMERLRVSPYTKDLPAAYQMDIWDGKTWKAAQKTILSYNNNQQATQRLEQMPGAAVGEWVNKSAWNYEYDSKKRIAQKDLDQWTNNAWQTVNRYQYTYQGNDDQPFNELWLSEKDGNLVPIDSVLTWYDKDGLTDSTILYRWIPSFPDAWVLVSRDNYVNPEQKKAKDGKKYYRDAASDTWKVYEETTITPGDGIYTDEPQEVLLRVEDPLSGEWKDKKRTTTEYKALANGKVFGSIRIEEADAEGAWAETLYAEAWFSAGPSPIAPDTMTERGADRFTFSYVCGLPNPYVANYTLTFPEQKDLAGDYELRIFSDEGRLVYRRAYGPGGSGTVDALLEPGFYIASVSKGGVPLCSQKLVVR